MLDKLKSFKLSTNIIIIISAIIVLVFGYIFYLNYYVKAKESSITSTRFRVLDQIGDNIDLKLGGYINNAQNQVDKINSDSASYEELKKYIRRKYSRRSSEDFYDAIIDFINNYGDINKALEIVNIVPQSNAKKALQEASENLPHNKFLLTIQTQNERLARLKGGGRADEDEVIVIIEASYDQLLDGMHRSDVFDELIIVRNSDIIYNTLGQDMILSAPGEDNQVAVKLLPADEGKEKKKSDEESPENKIIPGAIFSGSAFDLDISNISYKAFLKPAEVDENTWYLVGLMKQSNYNAARLSIAPWIIVMLSMLLILIFFGLPIIKLKVMSKIEQLDTTTIINFVLSMLLGGSLLILFVFFIIKNISRSQDVDNRLFELSEDIYHEFNEEINEVYDQLNAYNSSFNYLNFNNPNNPYNNNVLIDILNTSSPSYPEAYPFADYYFTVNDKGVQTAYLTPTRTFGTMTNLSSRDYVNKKDEWYFPGKDTTKFRIESIVSVTSGNVKGAMSMPSGKEQNPVIALSSKFYSIIDPIILNNYTFCIIDKTGKVWFHSDKNLNLKENYIDECDQNKFLSAAIYRDISKALDVNYYNNPHRIYIRPLDNLPLYMVTMYNKKAEKSFQAQVITLTMVLMGTLFFMLFIQIVALLVIERRFQWKLTKNIIMKLTRPLMHHNGTYKYLLKVSIIILIVIIPFMVWLRTMHSIIAIFTLVIYVFMYMYWMLNDNPLKTKPRKWFMAFNIFLLLLVNFVTGFLIKGQGFGDVLIFQAAIIATLALCHFYLRGNLDIGPKNYVNNYVLIMLVLLILFGVVPSLKFYELAYNTEIEIHIRHAQIDLMKQRENRNTNIRNGYRLVNPGDNVTAVIEKRKEKGIYTSFFNNTHFIPSTQANHDRNKIEEYNNNYWDTLVCYFRPFYDDYVTENKYLVFNRQANSGMEWKKTDNNSLLFQYVSLTEDPKQKELLLKEIESATPKMLFYLPFHWRDYSLWQVFIYNFLFWIVVAGILSIFYSLLRFGTRKIYCLDIIENYSHQAFIERVTHQLIARNDLMIYRLSAIDETPGFKNTLAKTFESITIDWANMDSVENTPKKINEGRANFVERLRTSPDTMKSNGLIGKSLVVILDHFDWNYDDPAIFSRKIEMIQLFFEQKDIILILLSQTSGTAIAEHYENLVEQNKGTEEDQDKWMKIRADFINFEKRLVVIKQSVNYKRSFIEENKFCKKIPTELSLEGLIEEELAATDYLKQLEPAMLVFCESQCKAAHITNPEETIINRIDLLAEKYYRTLLSTCTAEEKYVLHDTAEDLIVNPNNTRAITSLLEKGLLIKKCDKINFMNISFRRYVLNNLDTNELTKIELEMGTETGTWQGYKVTLIMVILGLFVFIAMANQDFVDNLNQLFVLIGGGIAVITGILGLLSRKSNPDSD